MILMEETQFSIQVWNQLPKHLRESAIRMTHNEVAWNKTDSLAIFEIFQKINTALVGIEFFYFNKISKQVFATLEIFSADKQYNETWQEFVLRSYKGAKLFVLERKSDEEDLKRGEPVFNIWALTQEEYFNSEVISE